jgi:hypothetical protein
MVVRGDGTRSAHRTPRGPRRIGLLITTAALGAIGFSLISIGPSTDLTVLAARAQTTTGLLGDRAQEQAASGGVARDSSAIQELNDPGDAAVDPQSPQAVSATAQDGARAEALLAAAAREAQAAATPQARPAVPDDAGTAGPDAYRAYARTKLSTAQFTCLDNLWNRESGWRPRAQNPSSTAYGIPQLLDRTWAATGVTKTSNGYRQVDAGLVYVDAAYGTPCGAWAHEKSDGWY